MGRGWQGLVEVYMGCSGWQGWIKVYRGGRGW